MLKYFFIHIIGTMVLLGGAVAAISWLTNDVKTECPKGIAHCLGKAMGEAKQEFDAGVKEGEDDTDQLHEY